MYYFNLKQQIFARCARFSSISNNMNKLKLQNRIFKRILSSKGATFCGALCAHFLPLPPLIVFGPPICPLKIQVLVPPLHVTCPENVCFRDVLQLQWIYSTAKEHLIYLNDLQYLCMEFILKTKLWKNERWNLKHGFL